jgi:hypothetical protein
MSNIKHRINENTISKKVISDLNHYFSDLTAGSPTHKFAVREILKSALIDSNFHNLANKLDTLIPGAKWDEKEQGIPASSAIRLIKRKGEDVAKDSKWDAETIINSVSAYLVKTDSNTAKRVQSLKQDMNESMTSWISNYVSELSENDNPCWDGYEMVGMKTKDGKEVPNCVPKNESVKEATPEEEDEFHRNLDKLVHKTFGHSSDEKKMNEVDSTQLDKRKEQLLKKVEPLIAKKKKLYSDVDITTPMSSDEKKLNKEIADIFSEIQSIIRQKRNLKKENKHIKEGNAFTGALYNARKEGLKEFEFNGKKYPVYEETEDLLGENVNEETRFSSQSLIVNLTPKIEKSVKQLKQKFPQYTFDIVKNVYETDGSYTLHISGKNTSPKDDVIVSKLANKVVENVNEGTLQFKNLKKGDILVGKFAPYKEMEVVSSTDKSARVKSSKGGVVDIYSTNNYKLKENVNKKIPEPIQNLIKSMIDNKIQRKTIKIKDNSKFQKFISDIQLAVKDKLILVKKNPIDETEVWISLGPNAQRYIMKNESITEGVWSNIMKGVKSNGSGPWSIVAIENNKVVNQEININIPQMIPAHYEAMKRKYPNARIRIENGEGMIVWKSNK